MTAASNKLAKAQEVAALKGLRAAVPFYVEATDALAQEQRYDAAVGVLVEILNAREKKRGLFGAKEINPLGPDRATIAKQFAKMSRHGQMNDDLLELLSAIAVENPDDPDVRLANAEGLYRAGYMADALDEYRYCERLIPDDGALTARVGELYAIMSRAPEAVDHLRRGIGELLQAHHFVDVPHFALRFLEVEPSGAADVQRWLNSLPDDALRRGRKDISNLIDWAREKGLDDGRWSALEQRLAALPPLDDDEEALAAATLRAYTSKAETAPDDQAVEEETLAAPPAPEADFEPVWGSKTGNVAIGRNAWEDITSVEPASEDEMTMLLGPNPAKQPESPSAQPIAQNGVVGAPAAASAKDVKPPNAPASKDPVPSVRPSSPAASPPASAGGSLPPGLAAFTRRKADAAFNSGDFAGAAVSYERLLKNGFDAGIATPLLECYLGTERFAEASQLGLQLAEHHAEAGELDQAVAALALVLEHTQDPDVKRRHSELLAAK